MWPDMEKQFLVLFVRMEPIRRNVASEVGETDGLPRSLCGSCLLYSAVFMFGFDSRNRKDDLNKGTVTAVCELTTETTITYPPWLRLTERGAHWSDSYFSASSLSNQE